MKRVARYAGRVAACAVAAFGLLLLASQPLFGAGQDPLDAQLRGRLVQLGFTGAVESTLETRLGRPVDRRLANIGRLLWFDTVTGLHGDNSCGGCHSPTHGFGDSQPIAIGIDNNGIVGPDRAGPRNMRRAPMVLNTAFFPALMWNGRFSSISGDPFDNSQGFQFPPPEGLTLSGEPQLLVCVWPPFCSVPLRLPARLPEPFRAPWLALLSPPGISVLSIATTWGSSK